MPVVVQVAAPRASLPSMLPSMLPTMLSTAIVLGCVAISCASVPPPPPAQASVARSDEDVVALRARVTRLERRLADVDAKLGLLLAQRATARSPGSGRRVIDLGNPEGRLPVGDTFAETEEASLGARMTGGSIDLAPGGFEDQPVDVEPDVVDDGSPPVVIRLRGTPEARGTGAGSSLPLTSSSSVQERYEWAHGRLKEGKMLEAIAVLEEILLRNGSHDLADNAMYWIGWAHAQRGEHRLAVTAWQRLPLRFPKSPKVPDALYGMAVSHEALGEPAVAETLYEQITLQYPAAEKVREARQGLERLRPR